MKVKQMKVTELKPFVKNPKKHPVEQLEMLKKSIKEFGWTNPILIANDKMVVAGHARLQAAIELNLTEVPVIQLDLSYEKAVAYVIADNRLAELAESDTEKMAELLNEIIAGEYITDIESIGYSADDIDNLINNEFNEIELDDFLLSDIELEPCWFVIRGAEDDFETIKEHISKLTATTEVTNSHD